MTGDRIDECVPGTFHRAMTPMTGATPGRTRRTALAAALLAVACNGRGPSAVHDLRVDDYASCAGTTDATDDINAALAAATGRTLFVPSGCKLIVRSPSIGGAALTVPSETTILCEDQSAGFFLARQYCNGGHYPGAACTADADCLGGGACTFDVGSSAFARQNAGDSFTVLKAAANSRRVAIKNCRIWANGVDAYGRCSAGTNAGKPCAHVCDGNTSAACDSNQDCADQRAGTTCLNLADCQTATPTPGVCNAQTGTPVGSGTVNLIDFSAATDAVIESIIVLDHRNGDFAFMVGSGNNSRISWSDNQQRSVAAWPGSYIAPIVPAPTWTVTTAASMAGAGAVDGNTLSGFTHGIRVTGNPATITRNKVRALDTSSAASYGIYSAGTSNHISANNIATSWTATGAIGIFIKGQQQQVIGNLVAAHIGLKTDVGTANVTIQGNRFFGGAAQKIICQGAGCLIADNYLAWGTTNNPILQIGTTDTRAVGGGHPVITGNLFFSDLRGATGITFADTGKRCASGSKTNEACANNNCTDCPRATGCPRACTGTCCAATVYGEIVVANNAFLSMATGIETSGLTSGNTTIIGLSVTNNLFGIQVGDGLKFPATASYLTQAYIASNNFCSLGGAPITNWSHTMGSMLENGCLAAADDIVQTVTLTNKNGSSLTAGDAVEIETTTDNAVKQATARSLKPIGIAPTGAANHAVERIALRGTTTCNTTDITIARGDRLKMSATPGKLGLARSADRAFAVALTARTASGGAQSVRCLLIP